MTKYRNLLGRLWSDFLESFKIGPRGHFGQLKGEDHLGNKYFELSADPQGGRRKSTRWFENPDPNDLIPEVPHEWKAWLRRQRDVPPTQEEIIRNMAMEKLKQQNAAKLDDKFGSKSSDSGKSHFPEYAEYRHHPGLKRR